MKFLGNIIKKHSYKKSLIIFIIQCERMNSLNYDESIQINPFLDGIINQTLQKCSFSLQNQFDRQTIEIKVSITSHSQNTA